MYLLFDRKKIVKLANVKKKHIICLKFVTYLLLDRKKNARRKIIANVKKWRLNVIFDVAIECVIFDVEIERVVFDVEIENFDVEIENFDVEIERVRELKIIFDVAIECVIFDVEIERVRFIICIIFDFLIIIFFVIVFCIIIFFWSIKSCDKTISSRRWFFFHMKIFYYVIAVCDVFLFKTWIRVVTIVKHFFVFQKDVIALMMIFSNFLWIHVFCRSISIFANVENDVS